MTCKTSKPDVHCASYNALLTAHGCATNVSLAKRALEKWSKGRTWDAISDQEWERWLTCSACPRSKLDRRKAFNAWKRVAWEALGTLATLYTEDGRAGHMKENRDDGEPDWIEEEEATLSLSSEAGSPQTCTL